MTPRERATLIARVVDEQANDGALWVRAEYASEAYMQQALRRLHAAIKGDAELVDRLDPED